jgi:hypothetical protein
LSYNWANWELTVDPSTSNPGDTLSLFVTGVGGGNQLYNYTGLGSDLIGGTRLIVPYATNPQHAPGTVYEFLIYNGEVPLIPNVDYTYTGIDSTHTEITFTQTYDATNRINLATLGYPSAGPTFSWSLPVFETVVADSDTVASQTITLTNSMSGTNPVNLIVSVNGVQSRPYEGALYTADGATTLFDLPKNGGYSQSLIANNDVSVYVNNTALILGIDFTVTTYVDDATPRAVDIYSAPATSDQVLISVRTAAQYWVTNNQLAFRSSAGVRLSVGDIVEIVSWNDTDEQRILTQVFVGPSTTGVTVVEGFDVMNFDTAVVNNTSGSYDYTEGIVVQQNVFDTGSVITDPDRLLVSVNGRWIFNGIGFTVNGSTIILPGPPIPSQTVVSVVSFTQYTVPNAMAFRIFQDMRGVQATYSITPATTTVLTQSLSANDDVIHVADVTTLTQPNFVDNVWGVLTIGAERIMYRNWDLATNTVSSLLRGTAGTAASAHTTGNAVYNIGRGNLLPVEYQDHIESNSQLANGTATVFTATDISLAITGAVTWNQANTYVMGTPVVHNGFYYRAIINVPANTAINNTAYWQSMSAAAQVFVAGILQTENYSITAENPVAVTFETAPKAGVDVVILVRRGATWYQQGTGTASNGVPLQETNTLAARFLRGL